MQKVRLITLVLVMSFFVSVTNVFAQNEGTIVDVASGDANFSTLVDLITAADLAETLSSAGPFTVFAPTNDALAQLPGFAVDYLLANPDMLANVLLYHVLPAEVLAADVTSGTAATALEGQSISISVDSTGVTVDGAIVTATDIAASNGVIHAIDRVLMPDLTLPEVDVLSVSGPIVTAGSSTVGPLTERMANRWEEAGAIDVPTVDVIGTGGGFDRFCVAGETDISNASRPIRPDEVESCANLADPRQPLEIRAGTDALAVVVSSENDFVTEISTEELVQLFSTAETWSDVRSEWPDEPIQRFIPGTDSGTFDFFVEAVFDDAITPILSASNLQLSEDDNVLEAGVASSRFAIAFFGYAYYVNNQDELTILTIEGIPPNANTAEDGSYPLARPLFIYSDPEIVRAKPQVAAFINFYLTNVNEEVLAVGYFPASDRALNLARLNLLAAQAGFGGDD